MSNNHRLRGLTIDQKNKEIAKKITDPLPKEEDQKCKFGKNKTSLIKS